MDTTELKLLLDQRDVSFWDRLAEITKRTEACEELIVLSALRRKAEARQLRRLANPPRPLKLAVLGGCGLYPLHELVTHVLDAAGFVCATFVGEYDNYVAEITAPDSALYAFAPDVVFLVPALQRCRYTGPVTDPVELADAAARDTARHLLDLARTVHTRSGAEVILSNFMLPAGRDPGPARSRMAASDWSFRKRANLEIGASAPSFVRICDVEFLAYRLGAQAAVDARAWFESKQPWSPALMGPVCHEVACLVDGLRASPKKVLALDLDNTLWGGVVGDDGIEGIEIGDTSPRGEAFKAFQRCLVSLKERGVLLAVCTKNDPAHAAEPFEAHPEMVLRMNDFAAFEANWGPKSESLRRIADGLGLGLDSIVFVDDNPAEIELVRQLTPEVTGILLGPDPAAYVGQLQDCRLFEGHRVTAEDAQRTQHYRAENARRSLQASSADLDDYLSSLEMQAVIDAFKPCDLPRIAQLINKSNQFNVTTRRRTEAEVEALVNRADHICFSARLADRFGDHGLVSVIICRVCGEAAEIDTWLMSCRVVNRQFEDLLLNELVDVARARGCTRLRGVYVPSAKNQLVRDLYPRMGFHVAAQMPGRVEFSLDLASYPRRSSRIALAHVYEPQ